jgi:hypothetical protein
VARTQWLAARQAEFLAVPYFHVVFTLPAPIAAIAFQNKPVVYAILFAASAEAMTTLAVKPLSRLFRRLFLERLQKAFDAKGLGFFGDFAHLTDPSAFAAYLATAHRVDWIVHAKKPFGGPAQVLAYLGCRRERARMRSV